MQWWIYYEFDCEWRMRQLAAALVDSADAHAWDHALRNDHVTWPWGAYYRMLYDQRTHQWASSWILVANKLHRCPVNPRVVYGATG